MIILESKRKKLENILKKGLIAYGDFSLAMLNNNTSLFFN